MNKLLPKKKIEKKEWTSLVENHQSKIFQWKKINLMEKTAFFTSVNEL